MEGEHRHVAQTRTSFRCPGGLALFLLLAGCHYSVMSEGPAITDASREQELSLDSGRYCGVKDDEIDVERGDCVLVRVGEGTLTITSEDEEPKTFTVEVADLPRGARLVQVRDSEAGRYELYVVFMLKNAIAALPLPEQGSEQEALAREAGVALAPDPEPAQPKPGEPPVLSEPQAIHVISGDPDAVLVFMRKLTDAIFAEALGSDPPGSLLSATAAYGLRVGETVEDSHIDKEEVGAEIEALHAAIQHGIARE
jgi:hypothetical protein